MSVFVVEYSHDYEGESIAAAFTSLDPAKGWADANPGGDAMVITECDPLPVHQWERTVKRDYEARVSVFIGEWRSTDERI